MTKDNQAPSHYSLSKNSTCYVKADLPGFHNDCTNKIRTRTDVCSGDFTPLKRPNFGTVGKTIALRTNFFQVRLPKEDIYHYDLSISR